MPEKRIAVVGTGANGAAIAADMTNAGFDVTCVEQWPAHVEAIRARGVEVRTPQGEATVTELRIHHLCEVAELRDPFDLVYVVTKAYDARWHCELIAPLLAADGLAVGVQNGMTLDEMAAVFGPERTFGAVIEIAGNMWEPGVVERQTAKDGTWFALGPQSADSPLARAEELAEPLRSAGAVEVTADVRSAKWMKLVANAAEMVPSAILGVPLVEALHVEGMRAVMDAAGSEALDTALALGCKIVPMFGQEGIEETPPERYAAALLDAVLAGWSLEDTKVAVLQDWVKGRRAEGEEINGLVVAEQERLGGDAPVNRRLVEIARRIEAGELELSVGNAELLSDLALAD
ncbi:MAG TPA: 2-dehydropantoate 2-reductase N-terminal domain-containing protein [Solirubrobacterales bacterium]|nr:2-dehydropantoate 2-reductase N-terminal domain-containing protein [Solirubrobacterales bacterium]